MIHGALALAKMIAGALAIAETKTQVNQRTGTTTIGTMMIGMTMAGTMMTGVAANMIGLMMAGATAAKIHRKTPHVAQEVHKLMTPNPHHQQCLRNVLDKTYFTR